MSYTVLYQQGRQDALAALWSFPIIQIIKCNLMLIMSKLLMVMMRAVLMRWNIQLFPFDSAAPLTFSTFLMLYQHDSILKLVHYYLQTLQLKLTRMVAFSISFFIQWNFPFPQVYLTRTEGSSEGSISWKFDFAGAGLKIKSVSIMASSQTFHSGKVCWHLQAGPVTTEFTGGMITSQSRDSH